ncbi:DNA methyltransferase [Acidovorax sp. NCPPB 4044]|uniref:DNA methyltransferase n=1 Tax=Acidovorax sp. NCPPB 4044 TaxID=2940490 RepID=UPI00230396D1|nr:DNA methyltransferase [Acidovorax sp. NCPPB 4044]MDA8520201.1 site-specific DNA-methyltransferase [Acidovorax sp. NCPPB 4044]
MMKSDLASGKNGAFERLESIDWSFPNLSNSGIHSVHWYPATYLSAIPGTLIPHLTSAGETVLDPFCGSGTTGVEALRLSRNFVGIDTNPIALLMSEAKLKFADPRLLKKLLVEILGEAQSLFSQKSSVRHPNHDELVKWYHPQTLNELNSIIQPILRVSNRLARRTLLSVFSSILKNCSSQGKHWGWVCDNVTPKPNEIVYKDAIAIYSSAVLEFARASDLAFKAARDHSTGLTRDVIRSRSKLMHGSCVDKMGEMAEESVDLLVTSPPYYGVADYVKSQRLSYLWLDHDQLAPEMLGFRDFELLRAKEAGARSNRHRKTSHDEYMIFMENFFEAAFLVLKKSSPMVLVVGESPSRSGTLEGLIELANGAGFELVSRRGRDIRSNRRRLMAKVEGEDVLLFRKKI